MDLYTQMIKELKATKYPIILYGAGILAARMKDYLEKYSISISGYVVDEEYLPENRQLEGKPIYSVKEYLSKNDCNLIVAFPSCSEQKEKELKDNNHIKNLFVLDFESKYICDMDSTMSEEFYQLHKSTFDKLRSDLCDEESKLQFDEFVSQKRAGNFKNRISHDLQYFERDIIKFSENEVFVDCGAYDGDTILSFIDKLPSKKYIQIYAFDADSVNIDKMKMNLRGLNNIDIIPKGVYDHTGTLFFESKGAIDSRISDSGEKIEVTTIDDVVKDNNVTFIKMDIEGSELKALKGAEKTIKRCKPKLAICVYHRVEDLVTIPQYIQSLNPDYKLFFRNYRRECQESVIYAI